MPRSLRFLIEGGVYHVFNRGVEKRIIFIDDWDRSLFLRLVGQLAAQHEVKVLAFCLMNNHYHLCLQTLKPNLDRFMHQLGSKYAHYFNDKFDRVGSLFQGRFKDRFVEYEDYFAVLLKYIHENPREAGFDPESYPWSSYPIYLSRVKRPDWLEIWVPGT